MVARLFGHRRSAADTAAESVIECPTLPPHRAGGEPGMACTVPAAGGAAGTGASGGAIVLCR